jgi:hypothetical protein
MADLSSVDMAFAGFDLIRRRPLVLLGWLGLYIALFLILGVTAVLTIGPSLAQAAQSPPDPAQMGAMFVKVMPIYLLLIIGLLFYVSIVSASAYRAVIAPETGGPLYLSFGPSELRLFLLGIIFFVFALVGYLLIAIVGAIIGGGGAMLGQAIGGVAGGAVTALAIVAAVIVCVGLAFFLMVKFSLAAPATVARRELVVFRSWGLTRGKFWTLLGGYVLNFAILVVIYMIYVAALAAISLGGSFSLQGLQRMQGENLERMSSLAAYFSVTSIVTLIIGALFAMFIYAYTLAPAAFAYRAIAGDDVDKTFA